MNIEFKQTSLKDAFLIKNTCVNDARGCFSKMFERAEYVSVGIDFNLNEAFFSVSKKNVLRGLHFQLNDPQAKIVSVISGRIWDVIVDLRTGSQTYKKWEAFDISADDHLSVYVPRGFAHGFVSLEDNSVMLYQCDGQYDKLSDTGVLFSSPELSIKWPIDINSAILSQRDLGLMSISEYERDPFI